MRSHQALEEYKKEMSEHDTFWFRGWKEQISCANQIVWRSKIHGKAG